MVNHAYLAKMKLVKQQQRQMQTKQEHRRLKVITKLEEQLNMMNALLRNERYVPTKTKWITNAQGERESVVVPKRVRSWFWMNAAGCFFNVMYGSRTRDNKEVDYRWTPTEHWDSGMANWWERSFLGLLKK